ncbi:DUF2505 domain-containing protein [Amycolatopsis cihanbeyliensis]|uniref:Uncharacterized protein DUF2505 n=1 Tax=Amycolatopsis cihanbeyliensis TaxID=1128664 RepID=A0A542DJX0_AMYCI|nr:DUF2505 domain-containing protein [Amycolatopsis cihanbeyliensis]TQJ03376.1 uncharacterized protein DUF2505 [Amycolatopsis cihanbeyliensis]
MASRIEHRAEFPHSVDEVYRAQSDAAALRARLERIGGHQARLAEHEATADGVRFTLVQGISADRLPQAVRSLHRGDLIVHREQRWQHTGDGEVYTGTATASVDGVPGRITARTELRAGGAGAVLRATGEVTVRIPLVGGKLEGAIAEQVTALLEREAEFTASWLGRDS